MIIQKEKMIFVEKNKIVSTKHNIVRDVVF